MIDPNKTLNEFRRLFAKTNGPMSLSDIAETINFAIVLVPYLLKAFPNDRDLQWEIRSYMRRAFRNALRVTVGASRSEYAIRITDELAKKAGFHQYANGEIVSIFDCVEIADHRVDPYVSDEFDFINNETNETV